MTTNPYWQAEAERERIEGLNRSLSSRQDRVANKSGITPGRLAEILDHKAYPTKDELESILHATQDLLTEDEALGLAEQQFQKLVQETGIPEADLRIFMTTGRISPEHKAVFQEYHNAHLLEENGRPITREERERHARASGRWSNLQQMFSAYYNDIVRHHPSVKLVEPRSTLTPPGYASIKQVPTGLMAALIAVERDPVSFMSTLPTIDRATITLSYAVVNNGVQVYFLPEEFAHIVMDTRLPGDMRGSDLLWPAPAFALGLPPAFVQAAFDIDLSYLFVANMSAGVYDLKGWHTWMPGTSVPYDKFGFFTHAWNRGISETFVSAWRIDDKLKDSLTKNAYSDFTSATAEEKARDEEINRRVGTFLLKLMAILKTRPSLIEPGVVERPEKRKKDRVVQVALWRPNWIGNSWAKGYREKRARMGIPQGGTHASPGVHIREAHFTYQVFGKRGPDFVSARTLPRVLNSEDNEIDWSQVDPEVRVRFDKNHERIWIDDILINADDKNERD